jgi:hypothetical protein
MCTDPRIIYSKSLTDTRMWKLGLRPHSFQKRNTQMGFLLQCGFFECLAMPACLRRPGPDLLVGGANVQQHLVHVRPVSNDLHRVRTLDDPVVMKILLHFCYVY